jgi:hypothetical protein
VHWACARPAYPGDELDELDVLVDWHIVFGNDALLTSRKQQLKNESNAAVSSKSAVHKHVHNILVCATYTHVHVQYSVCITHLQSSSNALTFEWSCCSLP